MQAHDEILIIIGKKLQGHASPAELQLLQHWLDADSGNRDEYEDLVSIWKASAQSLNEVAFDADAAWIKINERIKSVRHLKSFRAYVPFTRLAVAASVIGLIFLGWFAWQKFDKPSHSVQAFVNNESIKLPDGSTVLLRKGSKLEFPAVFNKEERVVRLSGEAFFQVQRNEHQPFRIQTENLEVTVLGTSFMVNTGAANEEVVVVSGKVNVRHNKKDITPVVLTAGEKASLENDQFKQTSILDSNFISWKTGHLDFRNTPLQKVTADLEHYYEVPIFLNIDPQGPKAGLHITVHFNNQPLDQVLEEISLVTGLKMKKEPGKIVFSDK